MNQNDLLVEDKMISGIEMGRIETFLDSSDLMVFSQEIEKEIIKGL